MLKMRVEGKPALTCTGQHGGSWPDLPIIEHLEPDTGCGERPVASGSSTFPLLPPPQDEPLN